MALLVAGGAVTVRDSESAAGASGSASAVAEVAEGRAAVVLARASLSLADIRVERRTLMWSVGITAPVLLAGVVTAGTTGCAAPAEATAGTLGSAAMIACASPGARPVAVQTQARGDVSEV